MKKMTLTSKILISLIGGIIVGLLLYPLKDIPFVENYIIGFFLKLGDYVTVILTATLASIGTAGVPGAGAIMLSMVLAQVGLPIEGIALIMGVDRIIDMNRTAVNITGDAVCTLIIAKSEGEDVGINRKERVELI